ncbi:biotin carboxylase [Hamadaea flava]|uniref:ATP-grasp domain-containing protein n=1 Tax=Hamadaea flava TaxID=1742688 RepID=A0ABV8M224_9ACTN|nr:ATP-grasp domain-containing protein [Hamadaea flava]MCP2326891.1 biotin carboxylase [Hamadaea flava]
MTTLAVLGGADGAITTLVTARRLGLTTVCVDARTDAPAVGYADEFLNVSTRDVDELARQLGRRADLAGVVSPASDVNLPAQYRLAERLGLPSGLSPRALRASVDKGYFRDVCDGLGLPGPRFAQGSAAAVRAAARDLRFPVIVKPTDSSGGRGISLCTAPSDLDEAISAAVAYSASSVVIVEEFLEGDHYAVEAVVADGRVVLFGLGARRLTEPPHFVTMEHTMPGGDPVLVARCRAIVEQIVATLGYAWGSLNADLLIDADGQIVVIEMGARLGGNGSAELLGLIHGVDVTAAYVTAAVGQRPDLTATANGCAAMRVLRTAEAGKLVAVHGLTEVRALPGVVDLILAARPGDHVEPYARAGAKLGYLLARADDQPSLERVLADVDALLRIEVEPVA